MQAIGRPHQEVKRAQIFLLQSKSFPNASFDAVAIGRRRRVLAGDQNAEARPARGAPFKKERVAAKRAALALAQQPLKLRLAPQPARRIQAVTFLSRRYNRYSPRRRRPRARRLRNTARPPRVRLRTRNPWRLARRVFDGW